MPRYTYKCSECNETFQTFHGMSETLSKCEICGSIDCLKRVYDKISFKTKTLEKTGAEQRVNEFIKDSKQILDKHKSESRKELDR